MRVIIHLILFPVVTLALLACSNYDDYDYTGKILMGLASYSWNNPGSRDRGICSRCRQRSQGYGFFCG